MNTAQKLLTSTPKDIINEIQAIDRNILTNAIATDPNHIGELINLYQKQLQHSNRKVVKNAEKRLSALQDILDYKVILTQIAFGLYTQDNLIEETQIQFEFPKDNVIHHDFVNNKTIVTKEQEKPSFYTRTPVFGTAIEMSKELSKLIPLADNEKKINDIAKILIKEGKETIALNLSIDLNEKFNLKKREEVERAFMFELLPEVKGIKIDNPKGRSYENMTLLKWIEYLNDLQELMKNKSNVINMAVKDIKKDKFISFKTQTELNKFSQELALEDEILSMIAKEVKTKPEDLVFEALNNTDAKLITELGRKFIITHAIEDAIIVEDIKKDDTKPIACTLADFKLKVIEKLNDTSAGDKKIQYAFNYFEQGIKLVTDYEHKNNKEKCKQLWSAIKNSYKDSLDSNKNNPVVVDAETNIKEETTENKDAIVEAAHEKAIELEKKPIESAIKKAETQIPLNLAIIDIEKEYPEVWNGAKLCNNLGDFVAYLKIMLETNSTKELKAVSGRFTTNTMICCQLAIQYISKFKECKDWDKKKVMDWWIGIKNKYIKSKETDLKGIQSPNVVKESSGITKTTDSTEKKDGKNTISNAEQRKIENTKKVGEGKSSASALPVVTQQNATKQNAGQQNASQKPAGTTKVATQNVQTEAVKDLKNTKSEEKEKNVTPTSTVQEEKKSSNTEPSIKEGGKPGESIVETTAQVHSNTANQEFQESGTASSSSTGQNQATDGTITTVASTENVKNPELGKTSADSKNQNGQKEVQTVLKETDNGQKNNPVSGKESAQSNQNVKTDTPMTINGQNQNSVIQKNVGSTIVVNGDKYDLIIKEKETKVIRKLIEDIILDNTSTLTFNEKIEKIVSDSCLKKNRKWDKAPKHELMNFISSIIKGMEEFNKTEEAKTFIADTEKKKLEIQNSKNKK
jgi:hypothetical protein